MISAHGAGLKLKEKTVRRVPPADGLTYYLMKLNLIHFAAQKLSPSPAALGYKVDADETHVPRVLFNLFFIFSLSAKFVDGFRLPP